eukprot:gene17746-19520_t
MDYHDFEIWEESFEEICLNASLLFDDSNEVALRQLLEMVFTIASTSERANMLTKTHYDDLDVISNLLQEKEKDLEMAARIGQSLLQRNKQLLVKVEAMEDYMNSVSEREHQLRHDISRKNDQLKRMLREEEDIDLYSQSSDSEYGYSSADKGCRDESITLLEQKCRNLELQNHDLLNEAINLKDMASEAEELEQDLVGDCMQHLTYAKDQITHLTDEIALKFEDNVAQQEEITELISTVVELQRKQKQLATENDDLTYQLENSQENQEYLRSQVIALENRYRECCELLDQNQVEVRVLREQIDEQKTCSYLNDNSPPNDFYRYAEREALVAEDHASPRSISQHDSLALEIEECVKRELTAFDRNQDKTARVLDTVRKANRFLSPGSNYSPSTPGNISSAASFKSQSSVDSDNNSVSSFARSWASSMDCDDSRRRKGYIPAEKLQIVKPMEGSVTLHKWHHLASANVVAGLNVGNVLTPQKEQDSPDLVGNLSQNSLTDYASTLEEAGTDVSIKRSRDSDNEASDSDDDDVGIIFQTKNKSKSDEKVSEGKKQSTPNQTIPRHDHTIRQNMQPGQGGFDAHAGTSRPSMPDRSIITRNSSVLASLREGRAMLNLKGGDSTRKSRADAIDILANAMSKANIEAKTGQRILESMNDSKAKARRASSSTASSITSKGFSDMPKLNKVLDRLASNNKSGKVDLDAVEPALKMLIEKAASLQVPKIVQETAEEEESVLAQSKDTRHTQVSQVEEQKPDLLLPALLRGPGNMRTTTGILGNILHTNTNEGTSSSLLSSVLSSTAEQTNAKSTPARPLLTRSWSSGDLKNFNKNNISRLNFVDTNNGAASNGDAPVLSSLGNDSPVKPGLHRRSNSSASLTDLVKQAELKPLSASPPTNAAFVSFDSYGMDDFSTRDYSASSGSAVTTTSTASTTAATTAKPGFLRSLFLGSSSSSSTSLEKPAVTKRPSSVHEVPNLGSSIGAGSSASVESGMNRFGKALAQDGFSGFGFGFMSYFGGSKQSSDGS